MKLTHHPSLWYSAGYRFSDKSENETFVDRDIAYLRRDPPEYQARVFLETWPKQV